MERLPLALVEFPADEPERALRFWGGVLGVEMGERLGGEGEGWQSRGGTPPIGVLGGASSIPVSGGLV